MADFLCVKRQSVIDSNEFLGYDYSVSLGLPLCDIGTSEGNQLTGMMQKTLPKQSQLTTVLTVPTVNFKL